MITDEAGRPGTAAPRPVHDRGNARRSAPRLRIRTRTVLVSAAVLAITGGAAVAAIQAGSASGTGSVTTTSVAPALDVTVDETGLAIIDNGYADIPIIATNDSAATLVLPVGSLVKPAIKTFAKVGGGTCAQASFTVDVPTSYTLTPVQPGASEIVAYVRVHFVDLISSQNGCVGASIQLTWPAPTP